MSEQHPDELEIRFEVNTPPGSYEEFRKPSWPSTDRAWGSAFWYFTLSRFQPSSDAPGYFAGVPLPEPADYEELMNATGCAYLIYDALFSQQAEWIPVSVVGAKWGSDWCEVRVVPVPDTPYDLFTIGYWKREPITVTDFRRLLILPDPQPSSPLE